MGELHLDILVDNVKPIKAKPKVKPLNKELTQSAVHRETYKKQSGGGKFGDIVFKLPA
jgi:translation elongation factor EF-G